ncbi:MAG: hypothetical protein LW750_08460 [Bacteroidetes bacterium]|jgi:hypothetical protein|nr:hypothetical protein [Bacteroidota bacterium]
MDIITDDLAIFDILELARVDDFNHSMPCAFSFQHDGKWCLMQFEPHGNHKGCRLYVIPNEFPSLMEIHDVLNAVIRLPESSESREFAVSVLDKAILEIHTGNHFFDAH